MKKKRTLPTADMVCRVINNEEHSAEELIDFYDDYINSAARNKSNAYHTNNGLDEDLAQEIKLEVIKCLPTLRKTFKRKFLKNTPIILVIQKDIG